MASSCAFGIVISIFAIMRMIFAGPEPDEDAIPRIVKLGDDVRLPCKYKKLDATCLWNKDGATLSPESDPKLRWSVTDRARLKDHSLTIKNVDETYGGFWHCRCMKIGESPNIIVKYQVIIAVPPDQIYLLDDGIQLEPYGKNYTIMADGRLTLRKTIRCEACCSEPNPPMITWVADGKEVHNIPMYATKTSLGLLAYSEFQFELPPRENEMDVTCEAYHPVTQSKLETTSYFQVHYGTTIAEVLPNKLNVQFLDDRDWFQYSCSADGIPSPDYFWEQKIDNTWKIVAETQMFIIRKAGLYRCLAQNAVSVKPAYSLIINAIPPIKESKEVQTTVAPEGPIEFLVQPNEYSPKETLEGDFFKLVCQTKNRLKECLWERGSLTFQPSQYPERYELLGSPELGDCSIKVLHAQQEQDENTWSCLPVSRDGDMAKSEGIDVIVLTKQKHPRLRYNSEYLKEDEHVLISLMSFKETLTLTVQCLYKASHPMVDIRWMIGYKTFSDNEKKIMKDKKVPHLYHVKSTANFKLQKRSLIAASEQYQIPFKCTAEETAYKNQGVSTSAWFLLRFPTSKVKLVPRVPLLYFPNTSVVLYCEADGIPSPTYLWQKKYYGAWVDYAKTTESELTVLANGQYRCAAGNFLNNNDYVISNSIVYSPQRPLSTDAGSRKEIYFISMIYIVTGLIIKQKRQS